MSDATTTKPSAAEPADPAADLNDELRPEYDVKKLNIRGQGLVFHEMAERHGYVQIDADVRAAFPSSQAVNEALRTILRLVPELEKRTIAQSIAPPTDAKLAKSA